MVGGFKTRSLGKRHRTEPSRQDDWPGSYLSSSARGGPNGPMIGGATVAGTEALHGLPLTKAGPVTVTADDPKGWWQRPKMSP